MTGKLRIMLRVVGTRRMASFLRGGYRKHSSSSSAPPPGSSSSSSNSKIVSDVKGLKTEGIGTGKSSSGPSTSYIKDRGPVSWPSLFLVGVAAASCVAYYNIERERRLEAAMGRVVSSESDGWTPNASRLAKRKFKLTRKYYRVAFFVVLCNAFASMGGLLLTQFSSHCLCFCSMGLVP